MTERSMDQVDNSAVVDETLIEEVSIDGMCGVY
ncbi:mycofactocin precursor [Nocardia farcinica]|nr:mycofactocin precursor MftA [Nocardia farcinica]MBF6143090.1 mycofactocin precursor [Nocardia farcinica]MBF6262346.1 mycofactocin precursor [Nocardia farcinica]MBF6280886.1 mycofactocin precursor [Nocardia farcinica]MBF6291265.1 mycofactocin precursor [Nocardia farcinica]MBF6304658.1 mycofactocin precursor [Nocardia farcinica]